MEKKSIIGNISQILLTGIFAFFALACATTYNGVKTKEQLDPLMGKHISTAKMHLGPESYTSDDGKGGKIYTWQYNDGVTTNTSNYKYFRDSNFRYTDSNTKENYCRKHIYVNSNDIIYYWRWEGNRCQ